MPRVLDKVLYLQAPGLEVELEQGALQVSGDELPTKMKIPLHEIEGVMIFGGVNMTQPLALRLADLGIGVVYLTQDGDFRARLAGPLASNPEPRFEQYLAARQAPAAAIVAAQFIEAKLHNTIELLEARLPKHPRPELLQIAIDGQRKAREALPRVESVDQVVAIEAAAAQQYFAVFGSLVLPESGFTFTHRNRRPPRDPINAMLSFGYTLLVNECEGALHAAGLDPAVGFLHQLRPGRASLALDLQEEFRAVVVDALVLSLVNRRMLSPAQFIAEGEGIRMTPEARKVFLTQYELRKARETTHPEYVGRVPLGLIPHIQARRLARTLRLGGELYEGYHA